VPAPGLLRVVFEQSLICGLLGFGVGLGLAYAVSAIAGVALPQVVTLFRWQDILLVLAAATVMSLVAGLIPMQRVLRVDALAVFKA
jgi:ABC-type antimicrobial peptide transport system permease subunit